MKFQGTILGLLIGTMAACTPTSGTDNRGGGDGAPTPIELSALQIFGDCMTQENWDAAEMGRWAQVRAEGGMCADCHFGGMGGVYARFRGNPEGPDTMFEKNADKYTGGFFVAEGNKVTAGIERLEGACNRAGHPTCLVTQEDKARVEQFVEMTNAGCEVGTQ